jgi:hypothetical protein
MSSTYTTNTNLYYNSAYINTTLQTYQLVTGMSNYLTTANATSTYQTIANMSNYLTTTNASSTYQPKFTLTLPLSISSNIISIDLSSYYTKTQTDTAISNSFNKAVTIKMIMIQITRLLLITQQIVIYL